MTDRALDAWLAEHAWYDQGAQHRPCQPFSTDPAASKQLRDRMRELGWWYSVTGHPNGEYGCTFDLVADPVAGEWVGGQKTEEMAVALAARAALSAVMQAPL